MDTALTSGVGRSFKHVHAQQHAVGGFWPTPGHCKPGPACRAWCNRLVHLSPAPTHEPQAPHLGCCSCCLHFSQPQTPSLPSLQVESDATRPRVEEPPLPSLLHAYPLPAHNGALAGQHEPPSIAPASDCATVGLLPATPQPAYPHPLYSPPATGPPHAASPPHLQPGARSHSCPSPPPPHIPPPTAASSRRAASARAGGGGGG